MPFVTILSMHKDGYFKRSFMTCQLLTVCSFWHSNDKENLQGILCCSLELFLANRYFQMFLCVSFKSISNIFPIINIDSLLRQLKCSTERTALRHWHLKNISDSKSLFRLVNRRITNMVWNHEDYSITSRISEALQILSRTVNNVP